MARDTHLAAQLVSLAQANRDATTDATPGHEGLEFDAVYTEHFPFVWRCLRGLGVSQAGLDDAAQEVFLVVHRRLATFRGESTLQSWLYGILRNVASNHRRRLARRGVPSPLDEEMPSPNRGPEGDAQDAEAAAFVARFADKLDSKKRDVFILALVEEFSIPEVSRALSIPLNTAYTRLRVVREEFRRALMRRRGAR